MPYEFFLALRYLRVRRGRRVVKLTALAAVVGIACGVAALIVALALANGFRDELRDKILRGTAHITLTRADGRPLDDWRGLIARLRTVEGVADAAPTTYEGALLSGPNGASYTIVRGVGEHSERMRGEIRRTLAGGAVEDLFHVAAAAEGQPAVAAAWEEGEEEEGPPVPALIGAELAARTGLERVGAEGWIVTGEKSPMPPGFAARGVRIRVVGIFRTGLYDYDASWTYVSLKETSHIFRADALRADTDAPARETASVISVEVRDIYATAEVSGRIRGALGDAFTVVDWREANRPLFAALELERRMVALIIFLIMLVAALNITTTLVLVVIERRADIAILGALGAGARSIVAIFMIEGALIGLVGALAGVALGLTACVLGERFGLVRLPPDVYSLSTVPFHPQARDVLLPALAAFVVSLLATLYPARQAARVRPAEALRYE
jgi:lipoprotein-releasing system permease protein